MKKFDYIVIDTETTGLGYGYDQVLEIGICSPSGRTLLNTRVRPYRRKKWDEAQRIHGISPAELKDAPTMKELAPKIRNLFSRTKIIVGYNIDFDLSMLSTSLEYWGKKLEIPEDTEIFDVMENFAFVYGEYSEYFGNFKWQKLITAARYYGASWGKYNCHAAIGDAKVTAKIYPQVRRDFEKKLKEEGYY